MFWHDVVALHSSLPALSVKILLDDEVGFM